MKKSIKIEPVSVVKIKIHSICDILSPSSDTSKGFLTVRRRTLLLDHATYSRDPCKLQALVSSHRDKEGMIRSQTIL
jgi:hypothetical protein